MYRSGALIANRYEVVQGPIEKPTLAGGMGLVYLCVDHGEGGRPVALKTFRPEYLPNRDRFLREGSTWVELGYHPHIVHCYEVIKGSIGAEVFLALELVAAEEGKRDASLRAWLTPGKALPPQQALLFALHLSRGMKHATEKIPGLVHRDLKPENLLIGRDGRVRVTDFGLVGAAEGSDGHGQEDPQAPIEAAARQRTRLTHGMMGTPLYMSPEQCRGEGLDLRSDIYALGCMLYEMLTGEFAADGKSNEEFLQAHREGRLREIPAQFSGSLQQLLQGCLVLKREDRPGSWLEVEAVIMQAYQSLGGAPGELSAAGADQQEEKVALGWSYNALGRSYLDIGRFSVAREYFEKVWALGRSEKSRSLEAAALGNLGNAYLHLRDTRRGIEFQERSLAIVREIGDRHWEGQILGNLGTAYFQLGDAHRAIEFHEQRLAIAREIGDRHGKGGALLNLGNTYALLGDARRAIEYLEQSLVIAQEIGDRQTEGQASGSLGQNYRRLGNHTAGLRYSIKALAIFRLVGDRSSEAAELSFQGHTYLAMNDLEKATKCWRESLDIAEEIGDMLLAGNNEFMIAQILGQQGNLTEALTLALRALENYELIGREDWARDAQQLIQLIKAQLL